MQSEPPKADPPKRRRRFCARRPGVMERWNGRGRLAAVVCAILAACPLYSFAQLSGVIDAHDPSSVIKDGSTYYYYATGQGIISRSSTDRITWAAGPSVFSSPPAWTTAAVPGFTGFFWAPDIVYRNSQYNLYYAVSTWGSRISAIGLATSPTLNPASPSYAWTDQGAVIQSGNSSNFNAIDPSILQASTGRLWMSYGSYNAGIFVAELDPTTGKRLAGTTAVNVADNSSIEASALIQHGGYYYLMVNWGTCCSGINSTYEIRMGRSISPTGPYLDRNGVNMLSGGGTIFYDEDGVRYGPGQFAFYTEGGQDQFSYHYYDGNRNGAPAFGLSNLYWTAAGWPSVASVNPDWSGATSANWSGAGNWSDGLVPGAAGSVANFDTNSFSRYAVNVDSAQTVSRINLRSPNSYTIGNNAGSGLTFAKMIGDAAATINVSAGSHTIAAPISTSDDMGINVTPTGSTLTLSGALSGASLYKYGLGVLTLGGTDTFSGQVSTRAGTLQITGAFTTGGNLTAGHVTGDVGAIIISGDGSVNVAKDFNVGDTGDSVTPATGTLSIKDHATITVAATGAFVVGSGFFSNTAATGTVQQSGGTLTANGNFDGAFIIGGRGSSLGTGTYDFTAGTINANTNVRVGGYGTGAFNQSGGTFTSNSYVSLGRYAGSTGTWSISGGQLILNNAGRWLLVGESGTGTLNISATGQVTTANVIRVGHNGGTGTINLDGGGTLTTLGIQRGTGAAIINFNGGTLSPTVDSATFLQGLTAANIRAGGAVLNTYGKSITIGQPLTHDASLGGTPDGGLTKNGSGTLTLTAATTYTGNTNVNGGTLRINVVSGFATIGKGATTIVAPGATLELAGSVAALASGANRVNVTNDSISTGLLVTGTHQQVGNIDGAGTTQVNAGSDLTANHIIQSVLVIGGTAASHGLVTIDASDASGNPLGQSSGIALAGSLSSSGPFGADGITSANMSSGSGTELSSLSPSSSVVGGNPSSVPEPSTLLLILVAITGLVGQRIALQRRAHRNVF
jgi:autotransporter-associated beta strand protein/T5SS/PEP-CTERM-associated repeat protein